MARFSQRSLERLSQCHPDLQRLFIEVIRKTDCVVLCGHRGEVEQNEAVKTGRSKTPWPKSKHNSLPSLAVDVAPYPIDWKAQDRFLELSKLVLSIAHTLGIKIRWGGDWNGNGRSDDEHFLDMPHFELVLS